MVFSTEKLRKAIEAMERPKQHEVVFPAEFLLCIRTALDAGLSCEEIMTMILLSASVRRIFNKFRSPELENRLRTIVSLMDGVEN